MADIGHTQLPRTTVLYLKTNEFPGGIKSLWDQFDEKFPDMRGRKFYGVTINRTEYWAATLKEPGDDANARGVEEGTLEGGAYATTTLNDWHSLDLPAAIPAALREMENAVNVDPTRPYLEYYRSQQELVLMVPEKE